MGRTSCQEISGDRARVDPGGLRRRLWRWVSPPTHDEAEGTDLAPTWRDHKLWAGVNQPTRVFGGPLDCRLQLEFSVHHFIVERMLEREAELLAEPLDVTVLGKNLGREPVELLVGAHDEEP